MYLANLFQKKKLTTYYITLNALLKLLVCGPIACTIGRLCRLQVCQLRRVAFCVDSNSSVQQVSVRFMLKLCLHCRICQMTHSVNMTEQLNLTGYGGRKMRIITKYLICLLCMSCAGNMFIVLHEVGNHNETFFMEVKLLCCAVLSAQLRLTLPYSYTRI